MGVKFDGSPLWGHWI